MKFTVLDYRPSKVTVEGQDFDDVPTQIFYRIFQGDLGFNATVDLPVPDAAADVLSNAKSYLPGSGDDTINAKIWDKLTAAYPDFAQACKDRFHKLKAIQDQIDTAKQRQSAYTLSIPSAAAAHTYTAP